MEQMNTNLRLEHFAALTLFNLVNLVLYKAEAIDFSLLGLFGLIKLAYVLYAYELSKGSWLLFCSEHFVVLTVYGMTAGESSNLISFPIILLCHLAIALLNLKPKTEGLLSEVLESLPGALVAYGPNLELKHSNMQAWHLLGNCRFQQLSLYCKTENSPSSFADIFLAFSQTGLETAIKPFYATYSSKLLKFSANKIHLLGIDLILLSAKDCSHKRSFEAEMKPNPEQAHELILRAISHNLKTPLNSIYGYMTQAMEMSGANVRSKQLMKYCLTNCRMLTYYIDSIIDFTHIVIGNFKLNPVHFSLGDLLDSVLMLYQFQADVDGIELELVISEEVPDFIFHCKSRLLQLLNNLLCNAMSATKEGKVTVHVSCHSDASIQIMVTDTGCGISQDDQDYMKQHFYSKKLALPGRPLRMGLHISNLLALELGKEPLKLISLPGKSTSFWFKLDMTLFQSETEKTQAFSLDTEESKDSITFPSSTSESKFDSSNDPSVLVIDDNAFNRSVTACLLEQIGISCEQAKSGEEAMQLIADHQYSQYRLALVDYEMPHMTGPEVVKQLIDRQKKGLVSRLPVFIGYTSHSQLDVREECMRAGMTDCLSKPCETSKLIETVRTYLRC
mmetsp:Transcript_32187/g.55598  ORF Transcript_32187/g.55598 Transcript_32187/m.55598 type:complete len:618 (+) Transcript_32187:302-2155(+)